MKEQTKLEAFRQHWEQIRHSENMRLTFTGFYAAMVAAVLAFVSQKGQDGYQVLFAALTVISFLGFMLCCRIWCALEEHRDKAKLLARELTKEEEKELAKYIPYSGPPVRWWHFWVLRALFPLLYLSASIFFFLLALKVISIF